MSPDAALLMALRNDPAPESFVLVTVQIAAEDAGVRRTDITIPRVSLLVTLASCLPYHDSRKGFACLFCGAISPRAIPGTLTESARVSPESETSGTPRHEGCQSQNDEERPVASGDPTLRQASRNKRLIGRKRPPIPGDADGIYPGGSGIESFRQILFARRLPISEWRGTASAWPV